MQTKNRKTQVKPGMNVTPLVDIVLVLLIIFMVITPLMAQNFWVHLPPQEKKEVESVAEEPSDYEALVLSIEKDSTIKLNGNAVPEVELTEKLKRVFAARDDHVLFFDASDEAPYGLTVRVLDLARAGGAVSIAILTERPEGAETEGEQP